MKHAFPSLLLVFGLSGVCAFGQDAKGSQTLVQTNAANAVLKAPVEKKAPPTLTPTEKRLGQQITYGGYVVDALKAKDKHALLNLKQPIDPRKDLDNLTWVSPADHSATIILFRIKH
jgi:hypothetical protein